MRFLYMYIATANVEDLVYKKKNDLLIMPPAYKKNDNFLKVAILYG